MQAKGFFASLFDYSFRSLIAPRIIKILYVLMTIVVVLWTLGIVLFAFNLSTTAGIVALLIVGPIFFVLSMIWVRVALELLIAFFRIHEDVQEINQRGGGGQAASAAPLVAVSAPPTEPTPATSPSASFCASCGAERGAGKKFCTACGEAA